MALCSDRVSFVESLLSAGLHDSGIAARVDEAWLELIALPRRNTEWMAGDLWPLLGCASRMDGSIRVALAPGSRSPHLRADLPIEDVTDEQLERRVVSLCDDFRRVTMAWWSECESERQPLPESGSPAFLDPARIAEWCTEAGWPSARRANGDCLITLDAGAASYVARLESGREEALYLEVDLFDAQSYSPDSRAAVALLLLSASAAVRAVKAVVRVRASRQIGALAATAPGPVSPAVLHHALSSLAVVCQLAGREAQALGDGGLARAYLAWQGWDETQYLQSDELLAGVVEPTHVNA